MLGQGFAISNTTPSGFLIFLDTSGTQTASGFLISLVNLKPVLFLIARVLLELYRAVRGYSAAKQIPRQDPPQGDEAATANADTRLLRSSFLTR